MDDMNAVAITAIWDGDYLKYLPSLMESLWEQDQREVIIVTDGGRYAKIDALATWATYEKDHKVTVVPITDDEWFKRVKSGSVPSMAKLALWRRALRTTGGLGRKFVCLDVDSLVLAPLETVFAEASTRPFNLAMPRSLHSSGRYLYKPSLLAGISTSAVERELETWMREAIMLERVERRTIVDLYGGVLAAGFIKLESQAQEGGGSIIAYLPGKTWSAEAPPFEGAAVVHFRGSAIPDDPTWSSLSTDWHAMRERYFQRVGTAAARPVVQTLTEEQTR